MIDEENPEIAKRILKRTANFNHEKDLEQFRKTRKISQRLQKFEIVKRMSNIRAKTVPSKSQIFKCSHGSDLISSK